ncbi:MAG: cytochrome c oxidase assembly protein [Candidatus Dormiibacterota bacterium]
MPATWPWPFEPAVLIGVEVAAVLYVVGGIGHRADRWRSIAFWAALLTILVALQSPLEMLARQLFWIHMVQHLLLMVVAAPLLAVASPWTRMWRALPLRLRRGIARPVFLNPRFAPVRWAYRRLSNPAVVWFLAAGNLWLWHLPAIYDLTLRNHLVHHVEHTLFLALGIAFWAQVIDQYPFRSRLSSLERAAYVFGAMIQSWVLAAVLSFATAPFYAYALLAVRPGGISAFTDQQLGGGMMWVPGSITYSIAFVAFLFRWLADEEARSKSALAAVDGGR